MLLVGGGLGAEPENDLGGTEVGACYFHPRLLERIEGWREGRRILVVGLRQGGCPNTVPAQGPEILESVFERVEEIGPSNFLAIVQAISIGIDGQGIGSVLVDLVAVGEVVPVGIEAERVGSEGNFFPVGQAVAIGIVRRATVVVVGVELVLVFMLVVERVSVWVSGSPVVACGGEGIEVVVGFPTIGKSIAVGVGIVGVG